MLRLWRPRSVYAVMLPLIASAAAVLTYYAWHAAVRFGQLGDETIAQATLLLVNEKVEHIEQELIAADNTALAMLNTLSGQEVDRTGAEATYISTTLRAALTVSDDLAVEGVAYRGSALEKQRFLRLFRDRILPALALLEQPLGRLKHHHSRYAGASYLLSYQAVSTEQGQRRYLIVYHDTDWILGTYFRGLFASEQGGSLYNVVDSEGRRVYGTDLAGAGDYLVGRRFPTTLYEWRLQIAPEKAPLLEAEGRTRRLTQVALITIAFVTMLLGVAFLVLAADQERRLNALKAEFIANVSHELKTPLSVVRMFGELLLTERVHDETKKRRYLETICREADRLTALIEKVLDFSALERGKQNYDFQSRDLVEALQRALETFRYRVEDEQVSIALNTPETPVVAPIDEQAVLLAVLNLLDNAVKYGAPPVTLALKVDKRQATISVFDGGAGIADDHLRRVFDRFFRGKEHREVRGSGIGLALVKEIAEAHHGAAFARNDPAGGAVVGFSLPLEVQPSGRSY